MHCRREISPTCPTSHRLGLLAALLIHPGHARVLALQAMLAVPIRLAVAGQENEGGAGGEAGERLGCALQGGGLPELAGWEAVQEWRRRGKGRIERAQPHRGMRGL